MSAELKVRLVFSTVGQPRGRGKVERFFRSVNQLLLSSLPGYAPAGGPRPAPALRLDELEALIHEFVIEVYHRRPHTETGVPPQERWEAGGFLPHLPASPEALDLLLLTVAEARKVHPDGIRFQGLRYFDPTLAGFVGEAVTIRYDPNDLGEVRVFHQNNFVCRAVSAEVADQTLSLKDVVAARRARRQDLRNGINQRLSIVDRLLAVHQPPPEPTPKQDAVLSGRRLKRYREE